MQRCNRKDLVLGLICGLPMIYEWKHFEGANSLVWMAFFAYLSVRFLFMAFHNSNESDGHTKS